MSLRLDTIRSIELNNIKYDAKSMDKITNWYISSLKQISEAD